MTRDEMIEKIAAELWRVQVVDAGAPASVSHRRTPEAFSDHDGRTRGIFLRYAAAVLDLCGPKPLRWEPELVLATGLYNWKCEAPSGRELKVFRSWWGSQNVWGYVFAGEYYHTPQAAQAAAQSHADAAHWANTPLGEM